jgi:hypothetical protein
MLMPFLFRKYSFYAPLDAYSVIPFTTAVTHKYLGNIAGGNPRLAVSYPHVHDVILFNQTLQWKNTKLFSVLFGSTFTPLLAIEQPKPYLLHRGKKDEEARQGVRCEGGGLGAKYDNSKKA